VNLLEAKPTAEDFDGCDWEQVIAEAELRVCDRYHYLFWDKARAAVDSGASSALSLLAAITSFRMNLQEKQQPFHPIFVTSNGRSADPSDLTREQLEVLENLVLKINDPELLARVTDVLWIRLRKYLLAQRAVEAYLESAANLVEQDPVAASERLERALQLAASLGKEGDLFLKACKSTENALNSLAAGEFSYLAYRIMELILRFGTGDSAIWQASAEMRAIQAESHSNWHWARAFWELKATWDQELGDSIAGERSRAMIAETYVRQAAAETSRNKPSFLSAALHIQQAIGAYRRVPNTAERQRELHRLLLEIQKKSTSQLQTFKHEIDLSEPAEYARTSVQGKNLRDALFHLATLPAQPIYRRARKIVEGYIAEHPVSFLFPTVYLDNEGRVTSHRPSMLTDDQNAIEAAKLAEIYDDMNRDRTMGVIALIEPTRRQILLEHNIRPHDIASIIRFSPFVPEDHLYQMSDGLYYGLVGEFLASAHLLIPQVENSLRSILNRHGVITSTLSPEGTQQNMNLNRLLYLRETQEVFGEENVFDMRGLLVEKVGPNLRNEISHGMLGDGHFFLGKEVVYLWWLVLRLALVPIWATDKGMELTGRSSDDFFNDDAADVKDNETA
jgi:hypothetical protein